MQAQCKAGIASGCKAGFDAKQSASMGLHGSLASIMGCTLRIWSWWCSFSLDLGNRGVTRTLCAVPRPARRRARREGSHPGSRSPAHKRGAAAGRQPEAASVTVCPTQIIDDGGAQITRRVYEDAKSMTEATVALLQGTEKPKCEVLACQCRGRDGSLTSDSSTAGCGGCGRVGSQGEPLKRCSGCHAVSYCNSECQRKHWRAGHKAACKGKGKDKDKGKDKGKGKAACRGKANSNAAGPSGAGGSGA